MVRPTRLGRALPILTHGLGYTPDADLGDAPDPIDIALGAEMYFPYAVGAEEPAWIQSKFGRDVVATTSITFDNPLTPGGLLLCMVFVRDGVGATIAPSGTGWTLVEREFTGATADDWPIAMYTRSIQPGDGQTWSVSATGTPNPKSCAVFAEVAAASAIDAEIGFSEITGAATDTLTPVTSDPVILVSMVTVRSDSDVAFTPATDMTEAHDEYQDPSGGDNGPQIAVNYRVVSSPSGGYTVGSTGGGSARKALIAVSLTGSAGDVFWLPALSTNDADDATFDAIDAASLTAASLTALGIAYAEARRFGSARLRIALDTAGSVTYSIEGANASDFSDAVELDATTFTATGSLTAQDVAFSWIQTTGYRYYRLVASGTDDIRIHSLEMYEAPEGVSYHPDLTGRDVAASHPASSVSVSPTVAGESDVQAALEALETGDVSLVTVAASGSSETIDVSVARTYDVTLTDDCTLTLTGATTAEAHYLTLILRQGASPPHVVTWPGSVVWADGTPTLSTTLDDVDVFTLFTLDGGTVWFGFPTGGGSSVAALGDLSDVTLTSPAAADRLRYSGSAWVNSNLHWEPMTDYDGLVMIDSAGGIHVHEVSH